MNPMRRRGTARWMVLGGVLAAMGPGSSAQADIVMKVLVVNPSETEVKEFTIRHPLPPEVRPENVLDAGGLQVEYDPQAQTYLLVGTVTLKPKQSVSRQVVLEDVWIVPPDRFSALTNETDELMRKLEGTPYEERGRLLAQAVLRRVADIRTSQEQSTANPEAHINQYRDNMKALSLVESDLVSLRQLMVMAALSPATQALLAGSEPAAGGARERGALSVLATWRVIFIVLGLLGFVSLSFFLVWQRQLKLQLAKQQAQEEAGASPASSDGGQAPAADSPGSASQPPFTS